MKLAVSSPGVCSLDGLLYVIGGSILDVSLFYLFFNRN